jgi:hypothetical protein
MHTYDIPDGYITGLSRRRTNAQVAHLYKGTFGDPGLPMCKDGFEEAGDISIFRGNSGPRGVCARCLKRARAGLNPIDWPEN